MDLALAGFLGVGVELAEALEDLAGFEVYAFDLIIGTAAFNGGPADDSGGIGTEGIAHIGLFEDFVGAGACAAVGEELLRGEMGAMGAVDSVDEAELDGVGHGDAVVEVPEAVDG